MARLSSLQSAFINKQEKNTISSLSQLANLFNQERGAKYISGLSNLQDMMGLFGSDYGKGIEKYALAGAEEDLISRGLGSTTRPVAASVGIKANIEDMRRSKLADVMAMMAQYTQQSAPSAPLVSQTAIAANTALRNPGALGMRVQPSINLDPYYQGVGRGWNVGGKNYMSSAAAEAALQ